MISVETSIVALFKGSGQSFELFEYPIPPIRTGEMLVRVEACTICASDLHTYCGRRTTPTPLILGHEILGRLVWPDRAVDGDGRLVRAGERIVWCVAGSCRHCFYCEVGLPQKCDSLYKYGHEQFESSWPLSGGLSQYCTVRPGTFFLAVNDRISAEVLAPMSCATATVAAVIEALGPVKSKKALVLGAGMLGVTACAMLQTLGATVVASDVLPSRAQQAAAFGASRIIDARLPPDDFIASVRSFTGGRGADVTLELAGHNASVRLAIAATRVGGTCALAGSVFPQEPLTLFSEDIVRRLLTIKGVHNYAPPHLLQAREFLMEHANSYPFAQLVEAVFPLRDVSQGFDLALRDLPYRIMISPHDSPI